MKTLLTFLLLLSSASLLYGQHPATDSCAFSPFGTGFPDVIRGGVAHDTLFIENPFGFSVRIDSITVNAPYTLQYFHAPFTLGPYDATSGAINVITPDTASADYDLNGTIRIYAYSDSATCIPRSKQVHIHVLAHDNTSTPFNIYGTTTAQAHLDAKTDTRRITLVNNSANSLRVDSIRFSFGQHWSIVSKPSMPKQLSPYETMDIDVHFSATQDGMYKDYLDIYTANSQDHYFGVWYVVKTLAGVAPAVQSRPAIQITPNPSIGEVGLRVLSGDAERARLTLYDELGRAVLTKEEEISAGINVLTLQATSLPAGAYNCLLAAPHMQASARLLIVH